MMISRDENLVQGRDGKLRKIFPSPAPGATAMGGPMAEHYALKLRCNIGSRPISL